MSLWIQKKQLLIYYRVVNKEYISSFLKSSNKEMDPAVGYLH